VLVVLGFFSVFSLKGVRLLFVALYPLNLVLLYIVALGFSLNLRFVHLLSKDARRRVVEVMLSGRSLRELSELLGVTPAAISKYRSGATHPSDEVLGRILESASRIELEEIARVSFNDLYLGFENLIEWMLERKLLEGHVVEKLRKLVERVESDPEVRKARIVIR